MELAVELIVCTRDKVWHSHFEFVNDNGNSTVKKLELLAIDHLFNKINDGRMKGLFEIEDLKFVGVLNSQNLN